jgi:hypothetical protein
MGGTTSNKVRKVFVCYHKTALSALLALSSFPLTTHFIVKFLQNPQQTSHSSLFVSMSRNKTGISASFSSAHGGM